MYLLLSVCKAAARDSESSLVQRCCPSVCLLVCLSVAKMQKIRNFLKKITNLELRSSLTTLEEVVHEVYKEPIIGPLKSKIAEIRHLENRHDVIDLDKILQTGQLR